jgi:hypothetical protein
MRIAAFIVKTRKGHQRMTSLKKRYALAEKLDEGDKLNRRDDTESWASEEDCFCCKNGHPSLETFESNFDDSEVCFDCNFDNCQRPLYWMQKLQDMRTALAAEAERVLLARKLDATKAGSMKERDYRDGWNASIQDSIRIAKYLIAPYDLPTLQTQKKIQRQETKS